MKKNYKAKGFSLVELAVALVIISLIIASTLVGTELIRNAEVKAMMSEAEEYKTAVGQFQLMYDGIPGDMRDATTIWSGTANGDSDGLIDAETADEPFRAIEQLRLAELINGSYTGTWGSGFVISSKTSSGNVMESKSGRGGAGVYIKCCSTTDYARTINFNNHVVFFSVYGSDNDYRAGILTPVEAFSIDGKIDDGIPDTGRIGASGSYSGAAYLATGCYSGTGASSSYESDNASYKDLEGCQMLFAYDWD